MKALVFKAGKASVAEAAGPRLRPGFTRVQVLLSGICNTDLELLHGYYGFSGIVTALVSDEFPLRRAPATLRHAARPGVLKLLLRP